MSIATDTQGRPLEPGQWYAIGFTEAFADRIDWDNSQLCRYDGENCWSDEDGPVDSFFDPVTQSRTRQADAYMRQS